MNSIIDFYRLQESDSLYLFWAKELLVAILIFALFWILAKVLRYLLTTWGPKFTSFTSTDLDDRILIRITPPASMLVVFGGLYIAIKTLPLPDKVHVAASGAVFIITIAILTNIAWRAMDELLKWYAGHMAETVRSGLDRQLLPLAEKLGTIFLVGTALIIALKHFNYDILSLVTALGIGSLAIGMAAKDTLANMISGFTLMIDRPFRIGDRIQLSGGHLGDVQDIGLRSTKIKTMDNQLLIIPNSDLCNTILTNHAFPDVRAKARINIGVAYGSDVEQVKTLLVASALESPEVLHDPPPEAFFTSFGDSALQLALFFWVEEYTKVFPTTDSINTLLLRRLAEGGITIPYPTTSVYLHKEQ
ncbi:MAG TPA: mechanosensitive ion channel domain-containing protein [Geobacteraceae bacterium]|nr:mechanosensitive ion channel domain-containing protein [Geobacteraceae bacterium]